MHVSKEGYMPLNSVRGAAIVMTWAVPHAHVMLHKG